MKGGTLRDREGLVKRSIPDLTGSVVRTSPLFIRKKGENKMQLYRIIKASSSSFFAIVTASLFLLASGVAQAECTFFTGFVDNKDGTATDPRIGLMWKRCNEGYDFKDGLCIGGEDVNVSLNDAMSVATQSRFLSKNDWRLPTDDEFKAVLGKSDDCTNLGEGEYAASKMIAHTGGMVWSASNERWAYNFANGFAVRGNTDGIAVYGNTDKSRRNYVKLVRVVDKQRHAKFEYQRPENVHRRQEEARQGREEQKLAAFRKSLQEGDDTSAGVVVQVKGNLIKIQTNDSQCSQRDYNNNCTNYINTPAEKWFKRSEVYPK